MSIESLTKEMRANSERWFPQIHDGSIDLRVFYALGLAGEAGEVSNVAKKGMRSGEFNVDALATEMADTMTYLFMLADELDVDLVGAYYDKVAINEIRFGGPGLAHREIG